MATQRKKGLFPEEENQYLQKQTQSLEKQEEGIRSNIESITSTVQSVADITGKLTSEGGPNWVKIATEALKMCGEAAYDYYETVDEMTNRTSREMTQVKSNAAVNTASLENEINLLKELTQDANASYESRVQAIQRLNKDYPQLHLNLSKEGLLTAASAEKLERYLDVQKKAEYGKQLIKKKEANNIAIEEIDKGEYEKHSKLNAWDKWGNGLIAFVANGFSSKAFFENQRTLREGRAKNEKKVLIGNNEGIQKELTPLMQDKDVAKQMFAPTSPEDTQRAMDLHLQIIRKAMLQLQDIRLSSEERTAALRIAAQKMATKSRKQQLLIDHEQELNAFEAKFRAIDDLEKTLKDNGGLTKKAKEEVENSRKAVMNEQDATIKKQAGETKVVDEASQNAIDGVWRKISDRSLNELEKNKKAVTDYYESIIQEARNADATEEEIKNMKAAYKPQMKKEETTVEVNYQLKGLDMDQQIETKQIELSNKLLVVESDKQRKMLEIQIKYNEAKKKLIESKPEKDRTDEDKVNLELYKANGDLLVQDQAILKGRMDLENKWYFFKSGKELDLIKLQETGLITKRDKLKADNDKGQNDEEIKDVNNSLKSLNKQKMANFAQIGGEASSIIGQTAAVAGQFDKDLGAGLAIVGDLVGAGASIALGIATMDPQKLIQGALQMATTIFKIKAMNKQADEEIAKFQQGLIQQAIQYSLAVINSLKDVKSGSDSIFGEDIGNKLTQSMKGYTEAMAEQQKLTQKLGDTTIKTGVIKKKFLGITTSTEDVYEGLLKTYPQLLSSTGELDRNLAGVLLKGGNLSKEAETAINNVIQAEDAAKSAMDQMESTLSSVAGSLGSDLRSALVDAFKSGGDSAKSFGDSVGKIMEDLITQMLFSAVFGEQFKQLEDEMKKSYSKEGDHDLTDDITRFYDTAGSSITAFNQGLTDAKALGSSRGLNLFASTKEPETRQGMTGGGIAQASQESVSELSGRMLTSMMLITELRDQGLDRILYNQAVKSQLEVIAYNTGFCHYLLDIKNTLSDMDLKGVKMKMN